MASAPPTPTRQSIGARARLAREQAGLRQEDVAARLGIPRPSVAEFEAGRRDLSSVELGALADLVAKPLQWFLSSGGEEEARAWDPDRFRLRGGSLSAADRRSLLEFSKRCFEYAGLEQVLDLGPDPRTPRYRPRGGRYIDQGRTIAIEERRRLGLGDDPIGDAVGLLERQGVKVLDWAMPGGSEIAGALFSPEELGPCVLLNATELWTRRQFTAAHEYAHLLLDWQADGSEICFTDSRDLAEKRANAFAAEFLSPSEGVRRFLQNLGSEQGHVIGSEDVLALSHFFRVSYQTAVWRLYNLELVNETDRDRLLAEQPLKLARRLGYPEPEEGPTTSRFEALAVRAWRAGKITRGKLAELLQVSKPAIQELVGIAASP
jgi:Zn-dependent peptidase ImmA (M78 family)/transcriptional regulator with XRE-family HTH domain